MLKREIFVRCTIGKLVAACSLLFAAFTNAAVLQLEHGDAWAYASRVSLSNGIIDDFVPANSKFPTISLPRFNPMLGNLVAVNLHMTFRAKADVQIHCLGPLCDSEGSAGGSHIILLDDLARELDISFVDIGNPAPPKSSDVVYGASASGNCAATIILSACIAEVADNDFQEKIFGFTGENVQGFIEDTTDPLDDTFTFYRMTDSGGFDIRASQSGFPSAGNNEIIADEGPELLALLIALDQFTPGAHTVFYSDLHLEYWSEFTANVVYTFESVPVSVPSAFILLSSIMFPWLGMNFVAGRMS